MKDSDNSKITFHQNNYGAQNVTGTGDINHHHPGAIQVIEVLEHAIKRDPKIPDIEKKSLLQRLRAFAEEPYIAGLATSGIVEGLKAIVENLGK